ncbi:hypothetical protein GWK47_027234 [Chionoecetes opilio]|uniref:Uncharacterized protein n=1 Tax=Chionoecetes opilio TaxID=41210 RepID=A0A8J8WCD0_CHIOP|nr:hypothetical protein GWK47_027234 [Chionoecetes opilio]
MEEVRGALAGQWDLLQNLRYHTLSMKVRLIQLEAQLQNLSKHLDTAAGSEDADTHRLNEKESCGDDGTDGDDAVEDVEEGAEDDIQDLLEAMRNLTQVYSILAASNRQCGRTYAARPGEASPEPRTTTTTPPTGTITSFR